MVRSFYCHCAAILRLPSNLFYECSLLTRSKDSSPHPDAPYPLMFVCTSLERAQSNRNSWNEAEVKTILEVAEKYLKTWPARWGSFSADQVCLMARTHQQVFTMCSTNHLAYYSLIVLYLLWLKCYYTLCVPTSVHCNV